MGEKTIMEQSMWFPKGVMKNTGLEMGSSEIDTSWFSGQKKWEGIFYRNLQKKEGMETGLVSGEQWRGVTPIGEEAVYCALEKNMLISQCWMFL